MGFSDNQTFGKPFGESLGKVIQQAYKAKVLEKEFKREAIPA